MSNQISKQQRSFLDSQHTLSVTNLTEPAKIPKEVISEMFEASQNAKIVYSKLAGYEFKDKTTITAAEVLAYLKAVLLENQFFTFGQDKERFSKLISKLHRYLKTSLSSYQATVAVDVKDFVQGTDIKLTQDMNKLLPASSYRCQWVDFQGQKSYLFYQIGSLDDSSFVKPPGTAESKDAEVTEAMLEAMAAKRVENALLSFGKVEADPIKLSQLHQDVCDLCDEMAESEKLSQACNERDRIGYKKRFDEAIDRLGGFFKPPILSEEDLSKDVNCLSLVKEYVPELSIPNVKKLAEVLRKETGCTQVDANYCAILRRFHRIRYAK